MRGSRAQYNQALLSVYWLEAWLWTHLELARGGLSGARFHSEYHLLALRYAWAWLPSQRWTVWVSGSALRLKSVSG